MFKNYNDLICSAGAVFFELNQDETKQYHRFLEQDNSSQEVEDSKFYGLSYRLKCLHVQPKGGF